MATVERLARHWRNKTLERSSKRQLIPGPHRGHHVASSGRSTDSVIASLQVNQDAEVHRGRSSASVHVRAQQYTQIDCLALLQRADVASSFDSGLPAD
eukprot:COSAG02_NODE_144_length_34086_cov_65.390944_12_plen_98_part_00